MNTIELSLHDILLEHFGRSIEIPVTIQLDDLLEHADSDEYELDLSEHLRKRGNVAFFWHIDDVKSQREDLSDEQCWEVLKHCHKYHDAEYGMNWTTIASVAEMLYGSAPDENDGAENGDE